MIFNNIASVYHKLFLWLNLANHLHSQNAMIAPEYNHKYSEETYLRIIQNVILKPVMMNYG